jgi:hypothetical protein
MIVMASAVDSLETSFAKLVLHLSESDYGIYMAPMFKFMSCFLMTRLTVFQRMELLDEYGANLVAHPVEVEAEATGHFGDHVDSSLID